MLIYHLCIKKQYHPQSHRRSGVLLLVHSTGSARHDPKHEPRENEGLAGKPVGACCTPKCPCHASMSGVPNSALLLSDGVTKTEMFRGLGFLSDLIQDAFGLKEEGKKNLTSEQRSWSSS